MEIKINAILKRGHSYHWVEVFGYSTKGQPGLEIVGLGSKGRQLKEKLIFISKKRKLKMPLKRYVLCVDGEDVDKAYIEFLELPLVLAYWSMAGILPLKRMDNCFSSARVSLEGEIFNMGLDSSFWETLEKQLTLKRSKVIYLGQGCPKDSDYIKEISAVSLLDSTVGGFSYMDNALASSIK